MLLYNIKFVSFCFCLRYLQTLAAIFTFQRMEILQCLPVPTSCNDA